METFGDGRIEWLRRRARRSGRPVAAVFHDGIALTHPEWIPERNRKRFAAYAASLALCDVVICISRESRDDLARFWERESVAPAPLVVLPWPVTGVRALDRSGAGPDGGIPAVFSVSTLEPRKNHLSLLQACEALWAEGLAFRLVLAGQALPRGSEEVLAEIARLREKGRPLEWLREVDDAVLADAYRGCLFTVYPSLKEGFGLPLLESLSFGKACVCSDRGAIAEVAEGGGCLQVDVARPEALASAIRLLLESPAERRRLEGEASSRRYLAWPEYVAGFLSVLEGAVSGTLPLPLHPS